MSSTHYVLLIIIMLTSQPTWANEFYVGGFGGFGYLDDDLGPDFDNDVAAFRGFFTPSSEPDFQTGFLVGGFAGYAFDEVGFPLPGRFRINIEASHRENRQTLRQTGPLLVTEADVAATSLILNPIYEFDLIDGALVPYIGIGIGVAFLDTELFQLGLNATNTTTRVDDTSTEFAWQAVGGLSTNILPVVDLFAEVRYFNVPSVDVRTERFDLGVISDSLKSNLEYSRFDILFGVRIPFSLTD